MKPAPIPRPGVYELYWQFAYKRQQAFEARLVGHSAPWSNDPIIQEYKFCNVYRATDRVSQFLIKEICYSQQQLKPEDRLFQIVAFRIFSNIETWRQLTSLLGNAPTIDNLSDGSLEAALTHIKQTTGTLYTGAFILCAADAYGRQLKHLNHIELLKDMFVNQNMGQKIQDAHSLKQIYDVLHTFPLMGDFMSYQIAIDLNYSSVVNFSENEFTQAGPGALRGIKKVFKDTSGLSPQEVIMWMVKNQAQEFAMLGLDFKGLFGRPLQAIDCQGLFCETDKYCRVAMPELASNRSRIKAHFHASSEPLKLFFPPKWELDPKLVAR